MLAVDTGLAVQGATYTDLACTGPWALCQQLVNAFSSCTFHIPLIAFLDLVLPRQVERTLLSSAPGNT